MTAPLEPHALNWCFSTLGCADLPFLKICELAGDFHIPGIELRGIGGRMDMPQYCASEGLTSGRMAELCQQQQTRLVVAGSSVKLTTASLKDREELLTFCSWADSLHIPYVRVFGGGSWEKPLTEADYEQAVALLHWWHQEKSERRWKVELILETHDAFAGSGPCLNLNQRLRQPLPLIWDTHHTWRIGGESPTCTWDQIGSLVRHVHFKDSVDRPSARHPYTYVQIGAGQMPLQEVMDLLRNQRFDGFVSLEWERRWHPYLPPLPEALSVLREQPWFQAATDEHRLVPLQH